MNKKILILFLLFIQIKAECYNSAFAIKLSQEQEYKASENQRNYELAKIYFEEEKYSAALKKILELTNQEFKDKLLELKVNLLAGEIFRKTGNVSEREIYALEKTDSIFKSNLRTPIFLNKALQIANELKNEEEYGIRAEDFNNYVSSIYHTFSVFYLDVRKPDSSRFYSEKLLQIASVNNKIEILKGKAYTNIGKGYFMERNFVKAEKLFLKSIEINKQLNNDVSVALALNNLASIYIINEEFQKAKTYYEEALTYIGDKKTTVATQRKEMIWDNLAWVLYNLKDYKAYDYVTKSYAIRDSLKELVEKNRYEEIQAFYDVKSVKQQEQIKIERQERKTWIIGVTGILVSLLLLYLANLYKLRQRSLSLKLSQSELEQQRNLEQLKSQSQVKILNATIDGKETERKQIAEILHDNVSALLSSASMHLQASQKQFKDTAVPIELAKTQEIIAEASLKIRDLSHNLMSSVLLKFGLEYAVKDVAKKFSNSSIKINTAIHNVYRYSQDYEIKIFNVIQELINNILKHSHAKNAYIIMEEEDDCLNIIVKDDGVGFKNKLEEDKGVGINQIKARIHMMNGSFLIESSQGMGTKAIINIPVVRGNSRVYSA
ncbi:hypothetical protein EV195_101633 [Tenacibaculum skagerrakense]|uniref:Oxygen sensor histidine kinase NreB n=1 Tax=Tenacibaculum skagerrakense TaxID=186571 RepID=A0A4R2P3Z4_9FLAO|nr:tetratricopeptide repeat-containing sensor histidine kinase [Tenacibaculum skagerrakense]TCP28455.1 hypothetical protein EV195_101633 [Tenacibaculum skagerrakense]